MRQTSVNLAVNTAEGSNTRFCHTNAKYARFLAKCQGHAVHLCPEADVKVYSELAVYVIHLKHGYKSSLSTLVITSN